MVIDPELEPDFLQPPMAQAGSPFQVSSPPPTFDDLSPFSTSQSPAIHPHDEISDAYDSESLAIGHSQAISSSPSSDSSPADTTASADDSESATCASIDYHLILNGKFTHWHSISSTFY
jgi:hypothetical protein